jgi:hypothetical protein
MGRAAQEVLPLPKASHIGAWVGWTLQFAEACLHRVGRMLAWAVMVLLALGVGPVVLWLGYLFLRPFLAMSDWSWLWGAALFSVAFSAWKAAAAIGEIQRLLGRLIESLRG